MLWGSAKRKVGVQRELQALALDLLRVQDALHLDVPLDGGPGSPLDACGHLSAQIHEPGGDVGRVLHDVVAISIQQCQLWESILEGRSEPVLCLRSVEGHAAHAVPDAADEGVPRHCDRSRVAVWLKGVVGVELRTGVLVMLLLWIIVRLQTRGTLLVLLVKGFGLAPSFLGGPLGVHGCLLFDAHKECLEAGSQCLNRKPDGFGTPSDVEAR
mmetsp:Transcript_59704/g.131095  ORF Transcript_59704/g.131095 Transcript_59704/m.131095 type:complete len:213 (+) Transcript_59704:1680-2318(+)